MEKELANHVAITAFKCSSTINNLVPLLKVHCSDDEYKKYLKVISTIAYSIKSELLDLIYKDNPDIEKVINEKINKYGELIY